VGDIKVFRIDGEGVSELPGTSVAVEKSLQALIERHMDTFLGVRFLASERSTGPTHGGRIDTLGIDENGCPVIIEYKRALNENVINQGLFYLDWLLDHKGEFTLLTENRLGRDAADGIDWSGPRLLCIAGDFTKYDVHAVQQIDRNIDLIRYRRYGDGLLLLELVNATTARPVGAEESGAAGTQYTTVSEHLVRASDELKDRFEALKAFLLALGDDVQMKTLKYYFAFKRLRNFAIVEIRPQSGALVVSVTASPDGVNIEDGFIRDIHGVGSYDTCDLEITIASDADLEKAGPLLVRSYEGS